MSNNFNALADGSLLYDGPFNNRSSYYTTNPENPNHLIPKVPLCTLRRINLRVLSCGRTRCDWLCTKFGPVSPKVCNECTVSTTGVHALPEPTS